MGLFNRSSTNTNFDTPLHSYKNKSEITKPNFSSIQQGKDIAKAQASDRSFTPLKKAAGGGILAVALGAGFVTGASQYHSTSASLVAETIEEQQAAMAKSATPTRDVIVTNADGDAYTPSYNDREMQEIFCEIVNDTDSNVSKGYEEPKSWGLLACYKACIGCGWNSKQAIGLLACACNEGCPGLLQFSDDEKYNFPLGKYGKSYSSKPLFVDTKDKADSWPETPISGMGVGTAQWTDVYSSKSGKWTLRGKSYISHLKKYLGESPVDWSILCKGDQETYNFEFSGYSEYNYHTFFKNMSKHSQDLDHIVTYAFGGYEAGTWPEDRDSSWDTRTGYISHVDWAEEHLTPRWQSAKCIYKYFVEHELIENTEPELLN